MFIYMLFDIDLIKKTIKRVSEKNVSYAVSRLFEDLGVLEISVKGTIPERGPTLIVSNHTGVFDSLLLLKFINQNNYHFIALSTYGIFGKKIQEKLLPIYRKRKLNHKIYEYPLSLQIEKTLPINFTKEEIVEKNRESIAKAALLINQSHIVSLFPTGGGGKSIKGSPWKAGIGFLIKQITNPQTKIVFVHIRGTKQSDIVAYLHPFIRKLLFKPRPISVQFSGSFPLNEVVDTNNEGKEIAKQVEKKYLEWVKNI